MDPPLPIVRPLVERSSSTFHDHAAWIIALAEQGKRDQACAGSRHRNGRVSAPLDARACILRAIEAAKPALLHSG
jgi:hypothetical protein